MRAFVGAELAGDGRRDLDFSEIPAHVFGVQRPLFGGGRAVFVIAVPEFGAGLDHQQPSGEANAETLKG